MIHMLVKTRALLWTWARMVEILTTTPRTMKLLRKLLNPYIKESLLRINPNQYRIQLTKSSLIWWNQASDRIQTPTKNQQKLLTWSKKMDRLAPLDLSCWEWQNEHSSQGKKWGSFYITLRRKLKKMQRKQSNNMRS